LKGLSFEKTDLVTERSQKPPLPYGQTTSAAAKGKFPEQKKPFSWIFQEVAGIPGLPQLPG
jgi:hypothetical protein